MLSESFHLGLTGYQGSEEENALKAFRAVGMVQDGFGQIMWKKQPPPQIDDLNLYSTCVRSRLLHLRKLRKDAVDNILRQNYESILKMYL